jgi:enoyl-CoA hydratase/carnithine racemase
VSRPPADALEGLRLDVEDGTAWITLDRPQAGNAFTPAMHDGLRRVWAFVRDDPSVRVAVITGAGERHFCTGADLRNTVERGGMSTDEGPFSEAVRLTPRQNRVWKPVICAVNGLTVGGGLHFVVDSDIVVAADHAAFMDTHVGVGQVGAIENIGLAKRLPLGTALRMTLQGSAFRLEADRAHQLGLVDELVPLSELRATCDELAESMKRNSGRAMSLSQQAIWASLETGYTRALDFGWSLLRLHRYHPDAAEGPIAFAEKRAPNWIP